MALRIRYEGQQSGGDTPAIGFSSPLISARLSLFSLVFWKSDLSVFLQHNKKLSDNSWNIRCFLSCLATSIAGFYDGPPSACESPCIALRIYPTDISMVTFFLMDSFIHDNLISSHPWDELSKLSNARGGKLLCVWSVFTTYAGPAITLLLTTDPGSWTLALVLLLGTYLWSWI